MFRWLSLYWAWLLPLLALLGTLARLRTVHAARTLGLLSVRGWRWMAAALAAAQALIWLTQLALVEFTLVGWPLAALAMLGVMVVALRAARAETHPGLRGFQRPLPRDGLELVELEQRALHRRAQWIWNLRLWLPFIPALLLLIYIGWYQPERWLGLVVLGTVLAAPLLLTPYRFQWSGPRLLAPGLVVLLIQASVHSARLPPGRWAAPITGAHCAGQIRVIAGQAWCVDPFTGLVYQFDLQTGVVNVRQRVPEGVRVFAANATRSWVQQRPARGLVVVEADATEPLRVISAHFGAADAQDRLWVVDVGMELTLYAEGQSKPLRARDGLLNNTVTYVSVSPRGDVWIGSIGGASWLPADETRWRTLSREMAGLPGAVINFAFGPDGTVWLLWQSRPGFGPRSRWGVSELTAEGALHHFDLSAQTGLEVPLMEAAIAVDGLDRLWFATQSLPARTKYLGVVDLKAGSPPAVYAQGSFASAGPFAYGTGLWQQSFGVVSDGAGGILVFDEVEPWRHWRPGW